MTRNMIRVRDLKKKPAHEVLDYYQRRGGFHHSWEKEVEWFNQIPEGTRGYLLKACAELPPQTYGQRRMDVGYDQHKSWLDETFLTVDGRWVFPPTAPRGEDWTHKSFFMGLLRKPLERTDNMSALPLMDYLKEILDPFPLKLEEIKASFVLHPVGQPPRQPSNTAMTRDLLGVSLLELPEVKVQVMAYDLGDRIHLWIFGQGQLSDAVVLDKPLTLTSVGEMQRFVAVALWDAVVDNYLKPLRDISGLEIYSGWDATVGDTLSLPEVEIRTSNFRDLQKVGFVLQTLDTILSRNGFFEAYR